MNYYFNITLLPDAEMPVSVLMNAVIAKFHKRLCDLNYKGIGVSFPNYACALGDVLRIHGNEVDLCKLRELDWLGGMNGYCKFGDVMPVPSNAKHRTIGRKQLSMCQAKLNRLVKRGSIGETHIERYKNKMLSRHLENSLPYLDLVSSEDGHRYRRYIVMGDLLELPILGEFNQFGLSKKATVPWF